MFNRDAAARAKSELQAAISGFNEVQGELKDGAIALYELRKASSEDLVAGAEALVSRIADRPKEFDKTFAAFAVEFEKFHGVEADIEKKLKDAAIESGAGAGVGIAAGAATALMGPTAAMAVATTFGTASTGTAISALSGAAAVNASLAWLGGGTLAAGGGGMAAGEVLLALAGPIGWAAAGVSALGGLAYFSWSNSKAAEEAGLKRSEVTAAATKCKETLLVVKELSALTQRHASGLSTLLGRLKNELPGSYLQFSGEQLDALGALVNHVRSLGVLLNQTMEDFVRAKQQPVEATVTASSVEVYLAGSPEGQAQARLTLGLADDPTVFIAPDGEPQFFTPSRFSAEGAPGHCSLSTLLGTRALGNTNVRTDSSGVAGPDTVEMYRKASRYEQFSMRRRLGLKADPTVKIENGRLVFSSSPLKVELSREVRLSRLDELLRLSAAQSVTPPPASPAEREPANPGPQSAPYCADWPVAGAPV